MTYRNASEIVATAYSYFTFIILLSFTTLSYQINKKVYSLDIIEIQNYSKYSSLFEGLKRTSTQFSLQYTTLFLLRRLLIGCILVCFHEFPVFQMWLILISTLLSLSYLILSKPFENSVTNIMEIMNEIFVLGAIYHLIPYSDYYEGYEVKYALGWSLNLIVLVQILLNSIVIMIQSVIEVKAKLRKLCLKIKMMRQQKYNLNLNQSMETMSPFKQQDTDSFIPYNYLMFTQDNDLSYLQNPITYYETIRANKAQGDLSFVQNDRPFKDQNIFEQTQPKRLAILAFEQAKIKQAIGAMKQASQENQQDTKVATNQEELKVVQDETQTPITSQSISKSGKQTYNKKIFFLSNTLKQAQKSYSNTNLLTKVPSLDCNQVSKDQINSKFGFDNHIRRKHSQLFLTQSTANQNPKDNIFNKQTILNNDYKDLITIRKQNDELKQDKNFKVKRTDQVWLGNINENRLENNEKMGQIESNKQENFVQEEGKFANIVLDINATLGIIND